MVFLTVVLAIVVGEYINALLRRRFRNHVSGSSGPRGTKRPISHVDSGNNRSQGTTEDADDSGEVTTAGNDAEDQSNQASSIRLMEEGNDGTVAETTPTADADQFDEQPPWPTPTLNSVPYYAGHSTTQPARQWDKCRFCLMDPPDHPGRFCPMKPSNRRRKGRVVFASNNVRDFVCEHCELRNPHHIPEECLLNPNSTRVWQPDELEEALVRSPAFQRWRDDW